MAGRMSEHDVLGVLFEAASQNRRARIHYLKPGEVEHTERLVEPYDLNDYRGQLMVVTWQTSPLLIGDDKWRTFRLDRILWAGADETTFTPRKPITLLLGEVHPFDVESIDRERAEQDPVTRYERMLRQTLEDRTIDLEELRELIQFLKHNPLPAERLRAVHANVYQGILAESAADGEVSWNELQGLTLVRSVLGMLGWQP